MAINRCCIADSKSKWYAGRVLETTFIEIMKSLYVDDTITAEDTVDQVHEWRRTAIQVF